MSKGNKAKGFKERPEVAAERDRELRDLALNGTPCCDWCRRHIHRLHELVADLKFRYTRLEEEHNHLIESHYRLRDQVNGGGSPLAEVYQRMNPSCPSAPAPGEAGPARDVRSLNEHGRHYESEMG